MILALLAPLMWMAGSETHPALHPARVDLYLEAPDVPALVKAYEKAPVVQLLNDPAMSKIADVAKEVGLDLRTMAQGLMPVADAARPDDRFWPWSSARAASLSLALDKAVATGDASTQETGKGWVVLDFQDVAAAEQALAAIGATGGVVRVAIEGDKPLMLGARELALQRFQVGKLDLWFVRDDARLIGGLGNAQPVELSARLAQPETSFTSQHKTVIDETGFKASCGTTLVRAWSDLDHIPFLGASGDKDVEKSLVDTFLPGFIPFVGQKGRFRMQLCGDRFVSESLVERIGAAKQLDDLYGSGEIPLTTSRMIPIEAVGAWVMKIEPAQFEALLERTLARANSEAANQGNEAEPKISAAVGGSAAMFMLPLSIGGLTSEGGMIPPTILAVELKDGAAFKTAFDAWVARIKRADPGLSVEYKPYRKLPMYTFTLGRGASAAADAFGGDGFAAGLTDSMRPTLTILSDRILLTMNRKTAQAEVRRAEIEATEVHRIAREGAIPRGAFEASIMDWGLAIGKLYDGGRGALPMLMQGRETPFDASTLPSAGELFRFFRPSLSYSTRVEGKTYIYNESSIGPEVPAALALLMTGVSTTARIAVPTEEAGPRVSEEVPTHAEQSPVPTAAPERDATVRSLRNVRTGIVIYKSQFKRVPTALADLIKPTDAFPKGFIEGGELPKDGWGRAFVYSAREDGAQFDLRSLGPNGVDDSGAGDDVILP